MGKIAPINIFSYNTNARLLVALCVLLFAFFFIPVSAEAGLYHTTKVNYGGPVATQVDTLACGQCHTMHGTQGGGSLMYYPAESGNLYPVLLRASSVMKLCKWCHDGNSGPVGGLTPPDVFNSTTGAYIPSAGDFMHNNYANNRNRHDIERIGMASVSPPGYIGTTWFTGDVTTGVVDKYGGTSGAFTCIYCHDHHGNKNYRNLRYDPGNPANDKPGGSAGTDFSTYVSYRVNGTSTLNPAWAANNCSDGAFTYCDVYVNATNVANTDKYMRSNVTFGVSSSGSFTDKISRVSAWCGKCHGKFYGISEPYVGDGVGQAHLGGTASAGASGTGDNDVGNAWRRHPVGDVAVNQGNRHSDTALWTAAGSIRGADLTATAYSGDEQPLCLSCHYAHGGGNPNKATDPTLDHSILVMTDTAATAKVNLDTTYTAANGMMRNTCQRCHNQ